MDINDPEVLIKETHIEEIEFYEKVFNSEYGSLENRFQKFLPMYHGKVLSIDENGKPKIMIENMFYGKE